MLRSKILKIKYLIITSFAATSITLNAKINEVKKKIFSKILINLAKAVSLTTVENKISEMDKNYFTASACNMFTSNTLDAKIT